MAFGNTAGPGPYFQAYIEWRVTQQGETAAYVQHKFSVWVSGSGSFRGTILNRSWGGQVRLYGSGWYGDSGWINDGWVNYGQSLYRECSAWYTGYSGRFYKSSCGNSFAPGAPTWQPKPVTNATATRNGQTQNTVRWTNNVTTARPYSGIYVDRSTDGGDFTLVAKLDGNATSYVDSTTRPNHTYRYRVIPFNSTGNASSHCYTNTLTNPPTAPSAPTGASSARNSDTQNKVTWANHPTSEAPYASVKVERSIDGGAFSQIGSVGGSVTSYTDNACSADHSYRYRVRAQNASGYSGYSTTGYTYNTPAAPGKPTASRTGDTTVGVSIPNSSRTATATEVQRSTDRSSWTTIKTTSGRATSVSDSPGGGTFYYRARNTRGSLTSAWSASSDAVVTICAPAAPTLTSPAIGTVVDSTASSITLSWRHNPIDGSAQTNAQVRYSTDGSTWTTVTVTTAKSYALSNSFAINSTIYWQVRTRGVHADYGPWSGSRTFYVRQAPQLAVTSPGGTITNVPIHVELQYVDASGSLASMRVEVHQGGSTLWARTIGTATSVDIPRGEFVPDDGGTYQVLATARSTSGLQRAVSASFDVAFEPPKRASIRVEADPDRGYAELRCIVDEAGDGQEVESISIRRVSNGGEVLLGSDLQDGSTIEDRYAPLNTEYSYEVVSYAASGALRRSTHPGSIKTPYSFFYFGDEIARSMFDPEEPVSMKRANRSLVRYAGRKYPVLYDGGGVDDTRSASAHIIGEDEARQFRMLMEADRAVYKSVGGDVIHCAVDVQLTPNLTVPGGHYDLSCDITRIDGDAL